MTTATDEVVKLLQQAGPQASSSVLRRFERQGCSPDAARKRLERLRLPIRRIRGLGLPKGQQLLFLEGDYGNHSFVAALQDAWINHRSVHAHALAALRGSGGMLPRHLFAGRGGVPERMSKQIGLDALTPHLTKFRLVEVKEEPPLGECYLLGPLFQDEPLDMDRCRALSISEGVLLGAVHEWVRRLGFISYDSARLRDAADPPRFAQFTFDLVAPSYLRPLATKGSAKVNPGFVVADIWLGRTLESEHIGGFLRKCEMIRSQPRSRPFVAFLVAERFDDGAFKLGKKAGVVVTTPETLFGSEIAQSLRDLSDALTNAARAATNAPQLVPRLFGSLSKIEGAANNLRGPLFELVVAYTLQTLEGGTVDIGRRIKARSGPAEIDVLLHHPELVRACECRGHGPGKTVSLEDVMKWRTEKVPRWKQWLDDHSELRKSEYSFEYWTTGTLDKDAKAYLKKEARAVRRYRLTSWSGAEVATQVRRTKQPHLGDVLNEHYLRHPIAKAVR